MVKPWPVRINPISCEAMSSWLRRTEFLYGLPSGKLRKSLNIDYSRRNEVDIALKDVSVDLIAHTSRMSVANIQSMSIHGMAPFRHDQRYLDFASYILNGNIILQDWCGWRGARRLKSDWKPWLSASGARACTKCVEENGSFALRLDWTLPISISCFKHGVMLQQCWVYSNEMIWLSQIDEKVSNATAHMDNLSATALQSGQIIVLGCKMTSAEWFRWLRKVIEELTVPWYRLNDNDRKTCVSAWKGLKKENELQFNPFEQLTWHRQKAVLMAAANALMLMR